MVKRNKKPYKNCWNGIGGKIKNEETNEQAAIRECYEEIKIKLDHPKLFITYMYPETN